MNKQMAQHVAALVEGVFEATAVELRQRDPDAYASLNDFGPDTQAIVSLDCGRDGGNWQRNLVMIIEATDPGWWAIEAAIYDEDQAPFIKLATVTVGDEDLADVALSLARAGRSRLIAELRQPVAA